MHNTGSCRCGKVVFEVPEQMGDVRLCYCETCRKLSGSAFSAVALVQSSQFNIVKGRDELGVYESSPNKFRYHCTNCFSPIYVQLKHSPDTVRIRLGVLNFEPRVNITAHIWVKEKPNWYVIADALPQLQEFS